MIRVLIVDDEPDIEVVAEAGDGRAAVRAIRAHRPDLVFLDIQMPGLDGFGVLEALDSSEWPPTVVFVTAFDQHALGAFDTHAVDYIVKPIVGQRS